MKILAICHDHPAFTSGGTEILAHDLASAFNRMSGTSAHFLAASTSLNRPESIAGRLERFGQDSLLKTGRYDMFSMRRLDGLDWANSIRALLARTEPDIVHLHGVDRIGVEIITLIRFLRPEARLVLTLHDYQLICPNDGLLLTRPTGDLCQRPAPDACSRCFPELSIGRHALRKAHLMAVLSSVQAFITPSHDLRDRFLDWGLPAEKLQVLPNAVPEADRVYRADPAQGHPRNRFGYFGNFAAHKGLETLLLAARRLRDKGVDARINLHGGLNHPSVADTKTLETAIRRVAPMVQHIGAYGRKDLPDLMAAVDWVLVPSLWYENAPLTVLEARRAGRPVIASNLGGLRELVRDGVDGVLVPRGDAAALADTMIQAMDPAIWQHMADNTRPPMTTNESAARHLSLFQSLTERVPA